MKTLTLQEEKDILNSIADGHHNFIGSGYSRVVFEYDENSVVKIAMCPEGIIQNNNECDVSSRLDRYVMPVLACGINIIVMAKCIPDTEGAPQEVLDSFRDALELPNDAYMPRQYGTSVVDGSKGFYDYGTPFTSKQASDCMGPAHLRHFKATDIELDEIRRLADSLQVEDEL